MDGAGNPGGWGATGAYSPVRYSTIKNGENGTGGLLIIYANKIEININATIVSNGENGGYGYYYVATEPGGCGGGGSGAGSINVFYKDSYNNSGSIISNGGEGGNGVKGGNGGKGSISVGQIVDGTYVSTYTNY